MKQTLFILLTILFSSCYETRLARVHYNTGKTDVIEVRYPKNTDCTQDTIYINDKGTNYVNYPTKNYIVIDTVYQGK